MHPTCIPHALLMHPSCAPHVLLMCSSCAPHVLLMCPLCILHVLVMHRSCAPHTSLMCPSCARRVPVVCPLCAPRVPLVCPLCASKCAPGLLQEPSILHPLCDLPRNPQFAISKGSSDYLLLFFLACIPPFPHTTLLHACLFKVHTEAWAQAQKTLKQTRDWYPS